MPSGCQPFNKIKYIKWQKLHIIKQYKHGLHYILETYSHSTVAKHAFIPTKPLKVIQAVMRVSFNHSVINDWPSGWLQLTEFSGRNRPGSVLNMAFLEMGSLGWGQGGLHNTGEDFMSTHALYILCFFFWCCRYKQADKYGQLSRRLSIVLFVHPSVCLSSRPSHSITLA